MSDEKKRMYCFEEKAEREHSPKIVEDSAGEKHRTYECDTCGTLSNRNARRK